MTALGRQSTRASGNGLSHARGPRAASGEAASAYGRAPDWGAVERLLATLADTRAFSPAATSARTGSRATSLDAGFAVETDGRSSWILLEHLQGCWATFERLGRIGRADVLEPGRRSAFAMALFARVPGVRDAREDRESLVLEREEVENDGDAHDRVDGF